MLNVGMVGVGCISGIYLKNLHEVFNGGLRLIAVCDLIKERAENAAKEYGVPKIYDTMHELFADAEIDIVLNLTRPYQHFEVSKAALLAGKHVYSEKPLGADLEEGKELVALAEKMGLFKDIISIVSDNNTNINSANAKSKGQVGVIELGIELDNIETLRKVMTALQAMPEVFSVKRIQTSYSSTNQSFNKKPKKKPRKDK